MGPHHNVKIASPIPTELFSPITNLGTVWQSMAPTVFQQHGGGPNVLPGSKATYGVIWPDLSGLGRVPFIDRLRGWLRKQNAGIAQPF